jgi:hypothetical protein
VEIIITIVFLILIALVVFAKLQNLSSSNNPEYDYVTKANFLSIVDRSFFGVLSQAVGDEAVVIAKTRGADILLPGKGLDKSTWQKAFNRISAKHYDYEVCHPKSLGAIFAVKLDDSSHQSKSATKRDQIKDLVSASAGFPLIRIKAKNPYSIQEVRATFSQYLPTVQNSRLGQELNSPLPEETVQPN